MKTRIPLSRGILSYTFCVILASFLITTTIFAQTTYYVNSTTGSDANSTSQAQNSSTPWATIQHAIDKVSNGDIIQVAAGTYTENLSINKSLTLKGANSGISSTGTRSSESIITSSAATAIAINSDNVTIDGFTINFSGTISGSINISSGDHSNITVENNIIDGATDTGVYFQSSSSDVSGISITGNTIKNINSSSNSTHGILIGDSNGSKDFNNVSIQNNTLTNITSWNGSAGHGAYAILVNHANHSGTGQTKNLTIANNTINTLEGVWAHAIGLEGNTPDADVENNDVSSVTDHKTPTDAAGLYIGDNDSDNPSASTLTVTGNAFTSVNLGIENNTDSTVSASNNTYGAGVSSSGPVTTLDAPTNLSPNGVTGVSFTPTLTYDAVTNNINSETIQYTVQLSPESNFSDSHLYKLYNINTHTSQTVPSGRLDANTTYYWRVWAETETTHRISDTVMASFKTKPVNLKQPGNTITGVSLLPTFKWDYANVGSYTLKIGTTSGSYSISIPITVGSNATESGGTVTYNSTEIDLGGFLQSNTKYYWTVTYTDNSGNSQTFSEYYFTTVANLSLSLSTPSDGSTLYNYNSAMFTWYISTATGSTDFELQICKKTTTPTDTDWANTAITKTFDAGSSINYTVSSQLDGGTNYYWRVIAKSSSGNVVKVSSVNSFVTSGGAIMAYPSYPAGNLMVYSLTPTFYWYTESYEPDATFQIRVSKSNSVDGNGELNSSATSYSSTSSYYYAISSGQLDYSTSYYWQVVTTYKTKSTYSGVESFTTYDNPSDVVLQPTLSYPTGSMDIYTLTPTLYWYIDTYAGNITYTVHIKDSTAAGSYSSLSAVTDQLYTTVPGNLNAGDTYAWYVVAENSLGHTKTSAHGYFKVVGGTSSSVVLSTPDDGAIIYSQTPTLGWYVDGSTLGWSGYKLQYKKNGASSWTTVDISDVNSTSYTFSSNLEIGTTYNWQVALYNSSSSTTGTYTGRSFTVYGDTSSFNIVQTSPADNSTEVTTSPTLRWYIDGVSAGITGYTVTYTRYENHSNTSTKSAGTNLYVDLSGLNAGATYYWKVTANVSNGDQKSSGWFSFTTASNTGPVQPIAGSPVHAIKINTSSPVLSWHTPEPTKMNQSYTVQYSKDKSFSNASTVDNINTNNVQLSNLSEGQYYWRVKGQNSKGSSFYSGTGTFEVSGVTGVNNSRNIIPQKFEVSQNYPNPFNPTTMIQYAIPEAAHVSIKVYNTLGQEIRTLVNTERAAGTYDVQWNGMDNNGNKVSSGIYIYRVIAGANVKSMKMLLLK